MRHPSGTPGTVLRVLSSLREIVDPTDELIQLCEVGPTVAILVGRSISQQGFQAVVIEEPHWVKGKRCCIDQEIPECILDTIQVVLKNGRLR